MKLYQILIGAVLYCRHLKFSNFFPDCLRKSRVLLASFQTLLGVIGIISIFAVTTLSAISAEPSFDGKLSIAGKRIVTINSVIRVNQIEVTRTKNAGKDEANLHTVAAANRFRSAVSKAIPEAKVTWAFSWLALQDMRPNYVALRKEIVKFHKIYGDEITFIPGAYFAPIYNTREQVNRDLHDGLKLVEKIVGNGYRPKSVVAGYLSADNLRYLAEVEKIHVAQGTIWSQYGIDNGDGDGSICYPYYPSREHACKPAQGKKDFIDCVNLDGWTCDFICARRFGFEGGGNSRLGVGPIEAYGRLGSENGLKESMAITASHFDRNLKSNGFGWVTVCWELSLVEGMESRVIDCLTDWLNAIRKQWPDAIVPLQSEFGEAWRRAHPNNDGLNYRFVQRGTGVKGAASEPELEIEWLMNKDFRLAILRNWKSKEIGNIIDFTRYDLPATEPQDPTDVKPIRNWSLINRINQKQRRPEDRPIAPADLTPEEKKIVQKYCPELFR